MKAFLSSACVAGVLMVGADFGSAANPWNDAMNFARFFAVGGQAVSFDRMNFRHFAPASNSFNFNAGHFDKAWSGQPNAQNSPHFAMIAANANAQIVVQPFEAAGFAHRAFEAFFS